MYEVLNNKDIMWAIMAVVVLLLSQLFKLPIKWLTKRISNESLRKKVNISIMLLPLILGIVCDYFYCTYYLGVMFSIVEGVKIGGSAVTLYGALETFIKGSKSKETVEVEELANEIVKDGKVDKTDKSAVKEFYKKVK